MASSCMGLKNNKHVVAEEGRRSSAMKNRGKIAPTVTGPVEDLLETPATRSPHHTDR
jgi:hypothetical protein